MPQRDGVRGKNAEVKVEEQSPEAQRVPLAGEALEWRVAACIAEVFRGSDLRRKLRDETCSADEDIEEALLSPRVAAALRQAARAFVAEQTPLILSLIFCEAQGGQSWACKLVLDLTGIPAMLGESTHRKPEADGEAFLPTELEFAILTRLRELVSGDEPNDSTATVRRTLDDRDGK